MALSVEVAELVEIFKWMSDEESTQFSKDKRTKLAEEIGDLMIYLVNLSDKFDIDLVTAVNKKLKLNELKYPSYITRCSARKYAKHWAKLSNN